MVVIPCDSACSRPAAAGFSSGQVESQAILRYSTPPKLSLYLTYSLSVLALAVLLSWNDKPNLTRQVSETGVPV